MSKLKQYTATLPAHWANALINGDETGLEDDEQKELDSFLADNPEYSQPTGCSDEPEFLKYHDAPGVLACDCLVYTFLRGG